MIRSPVIRDAAEGDFRPPMKFLLLLSAYTMIDPNERR